MKKTGLSHGWRVFGCLLAFILLLWVSYPVVLSRWLPLPAEAGPFGDMYGALNTLFSGVALAGIVLAILLQQRELQLQRRELELTRLELSRSADAQSATQEELQHQTTIHLKAAAISSLAAMMSSHSSTLRDLSTTNDQNREVAREQLNECSRQVKRLLEELGVVQ